MASRYPSSQYRLNGYKESRFESPVSDELRCCICTNVLNNPRGCPNKHFFCHNCIMRHLQNVNFCPVCRVELTPDTLQDPPQELTRSIAQLRIHCDYQRRGCRVVVPLGELKTHVDAECEYNPNAPTYNPRIRFQLPIDGNRSCCIDPSYYIWLKHMSLEAEPPQKGMRVATKAKGKPPQPRSQLLESKDVIVIGGRGQDGRSLKSVERFIFREGRWIELPPMNTPRSFAAAVVVDNKIIVSGGDTGAALTDTIEILNLDETPLQWITSFAKLLVPLSAHRMVVYQGKLIVIGGRTEDWTTDEIYKVLLTPPFPTRHVAFLPQKRAWHGAELVNDKIFIFGGGTNPINPVNNVFVCDLSTNECSAIGQLPYQVQGMATVRSGNKVFLLGGVDETEQELDRVITYDTQSGEMRRLSPMRQKRGGCCAVLSPTVDTSAGCSSDTPTDTLVALGSLQQLNTVESYDFHSHAWRDMPHTREARELCTAVVSPKLFTLE